MGSKTFKELTTFRIGGRIKHFIEVRTKDEVVRVASFAKKNKLTMITIGEGSNILASDKDFDGLVIKHLGDGIVFKNNLVTAEAGVVWDKLVEETVNRGLQGIECLSGIPGTVGASPIQNIGAYGQELEDTFVSLNAYDFQKGVFIKFNKKDCQFGYRDSLFKKPETKGRYLICDLTLKLKKDAPPQVLYDSLKKYLAARKILQPTLAQIRKAVLALRKQRLPDYRSIPNAGSFFKNPIAAKDKAEALRRKDPEMPYFIQDEKSVKLFAAWLIEKAGWKGKAYKNAKVSEKNALVITNPGGKATAEEIKELAGKIIADVYSKFKIKLEPEVQFINF